MVDTLANKIRLGGGGAWGVVVMPANTRISESDAKKLAEWILDSNK
jgi:cytochrome c